MSSPELKEIQQKLAVMDDKLNTLVTHRAVQEFRIKQLEENQKGAMKFSLMALVSTLGTVLTLGGKFLLDKIGGL